jgi:HSP20 family protein
MNDSKIILKTLKKIIFMTTLKFNQPSLKTLDSFLDSLLSDEPVTNHSSMNYPAVNIVETNDAYNLELNAPGRKKEDFKITVDKNILTVSFEKKEEPQDETRQFIKREFVTKSFKRSFTLDEKINPESINAKYEDGLLHLILPKKEEVKVVPKEIAVQ